MKKKLLIIGANSFIAKNFINFLSEKNLNYCLKLYTKKNFNLLSTKKIKKNFFHTRKNDIIIFFSSEVPVKNYEMYKNNILILFNFCKKISNKNFLKIIYISSDAVYSDTKNLISEVSSTNPQSLHGMMHLTREKILTDLFKKKLIILRPTLVYGENDPHNGYGPNKFIRDAKNKKLIKLFGRGQEKRDHLFKDDLSYMLYCIINSLKSGVYNLASGHVISFNKIAKLIQRKFQNEGSIVKIKYCKRKGKMPHLGLRRFDIKKIKKIAKFNYNINFENNLDKIKLTNYR